MEYPLYSIIRIFVRFVNILGQKYALLFLLHGKIISLVFPARSIYQCKFMQVIDQKPLKINAKKGNKIHAVLVNNLKRHTRSSELYNKKMHCFILSSCLNIYMTDQTFRHVRYQTLHFSFIYVEEYKNRVSSY